MLFVFDVEIFCDICDFFIDIVIIVNILLVILVEVVGKLLKIVWDVILFIFDGF